MFTDVFNHPVGFGLGFATNAAPLLIVSRPRTANDLILFVLIHFGSLNQTELAYPTQRGPITASYNSSWSAVQDHVLYLA